MKPVTVVEVELCGESVTQIACVTDVRLDQGALVVNFDGEHGPSQTIFASGWWSQVRTFYKEQVSG